MKVYTKPVYHQYNFISDSIRKADRTKLSRAAKIATTSEHRYKVGAIVYKSGRILAAAANVRGTGPLVPPLRWSMHAEQMAIRRTSHTNGATLFVVRLDAFENYALARPCVYCIHALLKAEISRVVFSTADGTFDAFKLDMVTWKKEKL